MDIKTCHDCGIDVAADEATELLPPDSIEKYWAADRAWLCPLCAAYREEYENDYDEGA